jgi:lipopolysaccharide export system ATP-binding protein
VTDNADSDSAGVMSTQSPHDSPPSGISRLEAPPAKVLWQPQVVKDVSLAVRTGEVVGLLGPNGAGKTTSFYIIVGLVRASAGDITIDGQSIEHMPIHRRARLGLGYLPQEASIFRKLNVEDNVRAVLELQRDDAGKPLGKCRNRAAPDGVVARPARGPLRASPAWRCRVASAAGWRLPALWPPGRGSFCWTSPLPALTRLP